MNGRAVTAFIGILTVGLGIIGLTYPLHVMDWVGFSPLMTKPNAGTVEARAMYGGLFLVLGIFTLWAATSPRAHRAELLLIACLWLGLFGGRMVGVSIEGSPGLLNTLGAVFEFIVGCLLLAAPYLGGREDEAAAVPTT
jgi:uncharacterized protein DUF4345